ncbi:hypothetical protein ACFS4T_34165 [Pseudomonas lini]
MHNKLLTYQDKRYRYDAFGRMIEKNAAPSAACNTSPTTPKAA